MDDWTIFEHTVGKNQFIKHLTEQARQLILVVLPNQIINFSLTILICKQRQCYLPHQTMLQINWEHEYKVLTTVTGIQLVHNKRQLYFDDDGCICMIHNKLFCFFSFDVLFLNPLFLKMNTWWLYSKKKL